MMKILVILALTLAACSAQPPRELYDIHTSAKARIRYENYNMYDYRYVPRGTYASGNCAVFSYTVWTDLRSASQPALRVECTTQDNRTHMYTRSGNWALDVRFKAPVPVDKVNCI